MTPHIGRPGLGRAFLVAALVIGAIVAGCDSTPATSPSASAAPASGSTSGSAAPAPSPADVLAAAVGPLAAASEFESSVTVDGVTATSLSGRTVGSASLLSVTSSGRTVEYLRVPPNAWAREAGAGWVIVDSSQAPASPLGVLAAPLSIQAAAAGSAATLEATYAAAALGLEGDPVKVQITIDGASVTFRYEQKSGNHLIASATTVRPTTDLTPIVAPEPTPT